MYKRIIILFLLLIGMFTPNGPIKSLLIAQSYNQQIDAGTTQPVGASATLRVNRQIPEGIWGDFSYLDILKKYDSVSKADSIFGNRIIQLQIEDGNLYASGPYSQESTPLEENLYDIKLIDDENLVLIDLNTGDRQRMQKIVYDISKSHYYEIFNLVLNKMRFMWFGGCYDVSDKDNEINKIYFGEDGSVKGYEGFISYGFGTDSEGQDFIYLTEKGDQIKYKHLLINYVSGEYLLYNAGECEDIDMPLIKADLKMTLKKVE